MLELRPLGLHLLGGAGHDGDVIGGAAVLRVLLGVLVLQHGGEHLHGGLAGGDVLQQVGPLLLHVFHPRRAAAGEHGEGPALLQPLQELVCLLHHSQIRAEGGVIHLVGAHHLQGGHQLVQGVGAGLQAEGLAHRHPDRRGDLEHHPLLGVIQLPPRLADLIPDGDGAGGAGGGALTAADAVGLAELPVKGRAHHQVAAPVGEVQDAHALHLLAHPHTVAAQDALVGIPDDGRRGVVLLIDRPGILEADVPHAEPQGQVLEAAAAALLAGGAVPAVGGQHQLQDHPPVLQEPGGVGADHHAVPGLHGAGGVDLAPLVLHHAHPAGAVNRQFRIVAEGRHVDAGLPDHSQDVFLPVEGHPLAVDVHNSLCHGSPLLTCWLRWRRTGSCSRRRRS